MHALDTPDKKGKKMKVTASFVLKNIKTWNLKMNM